MIGFPTDIWTHSVIAIAALQKKNNNNKDNKKTTKGKFQLQMIICEKELEQVSRPVSF